jgi:hypothetical protein
MFVVMIIMLGSVIVASAQGSDRARERRGFETPPRMESKPVPVPDTGSTLTLLSIALGGGFLVRGWVSRSNQRSS